MSFMETLFKLSFIMYTYLNLREKDGIMYMGNVNIMWQKTTFNTNVYQILTLSTESDF